MPEKKLSDEEVQKLWQEYTQTKSISLRNTLVTHYLPYARHLAEKMKENVPPSVQFEDLLSAAVMGLMDAVQKYDPNLNTKFESYAYERIRGAMLDELRRIDWVPRLVRSKQNVFEKTYMALEKELNRPPTDQELARAMKISMKELYELYEQLSRAGAWVSLYQPSPSVDDEDTEFQSVEDKKSIDPIKEQMKKDLLDYISQYLSEKERKILIMYYYEDMTMKEIGEALGLSESRVCQIRAKMEARLKAMLKKRGKEFLKG